MKPNAYQSNLLTSFRHTQEINISQKRSITNALNNTSIKKGLLLALIFLLFHSLCSSTFGQIASRNYKEKIFTPRFKDRKPIRDFVLSKKDIKTLLLQDSIDAPKGVPFRFGKDISTDIDFLKEATKNTISDTTIYTLNIKSNGAFSINLIIDSMKLGKNTFLNIYNEDHSFLYGPIAQKDIPENGIFWTDLIKGDHIVLELVVPDKSSVNNIHISKVIHGYKNVFTPNNYGESLGCNIDITCPPGSPWRKEGDAVAMILIDVATRWCSGSLLNNTALDFKGFFLTAFHCLDHDGNGSLSTFEKNDVNNWLFRFKYESTNCNGTEGFNYITFNGSNFRAAYAPTDMTLLELYNSPQLEDCVSYAGWSRTSATAFAGTGIHHPRGDVKKISFDNDALYSNGAVINWLGGLQSPINSHWVVDFDNGTAEGGSSGSPIFDQNHRVIGQLHGGASGCAPITKYYGRFDVSWTGGGTNDTRLSNWLDPNGVGSAALNTLLPASISGSSIICSSSTFNIPNLYTGAMITWSVSGPYSISGSSSANPVTVQRTGSGAGTLTAVVTTLCGTNITLNKPLQAQELTITSNGNGYCGYSTVSVDIPSGNSFTWTVTGDLSINFLGQTLTTTDNNIEVTGTGGTISVSTTACGGATISKNYAPYEPQLSIAANPMYNSDPLVVTVTNLSVSYTSIDWYIDNSFWMSDLSGSIYEGNPPCGIHSIKAVIHLDCGASITAEAEFERYCGGWHRALAIYPNPANDQLKVSPNLTKISGEILKGEYEAILLNKAGQIIQRKMSKQQSLSLDTQKIPNDTYFLHLRKTGEKDVLKKQVIIQH